ncbi:MAG: cyanophycinase [Merismopedia sp. SIO2A8]|nr:cyanophycinase [Merismopedia sp. SIO2A8]
MQEVQYRSIQESMPSLKQASVLVIGGAEDKVHGRQILTTFFQRAGGSDATIGIVPCASREPGVVGDRYYKIFNEMGAKRVEVMDIRERHEGNQERWLQLLEDCTGIFLTGGDQLRLCSLMAETDLMHRIRLHAQLGKIALAGTSAGAAIMGERMIAGGGSGESPNRALVDLSDGLGIIPEILVDQHFHNRNRMARLMSAIAACPDKLGLGIDEDTCALFDGSGIFQVIGKGTITVVDPGELSYTSHPDVELTTPLSIHNLRVHVLSPGDRYNFRERTPVVPHG